MNEFDRGVLRRLFVDALTDIAIILLDVDGNVLTWNPGARAILGYGPDEMVGRHFSRLYPNNHIAAARASAVLDDARALGRHEETGQLTHKDGTEVEAHSVFMPLYDREKTLMGFGILMQALANLKSPAADPLAPVVAQQKQEQILVVDDDDSIREIAVRQLTSLGYRVIAASGGSEALEMLARAPDVDLLFTDVSMPGGMGGREVADKALRIQPGLKVLFASGYFEGALVRDGAIDESVRFLVKPYRKKDLSEKVKEVLHGTAS